MSREDSNRDYIKRSNFPKQTYALSGTDWGNASEGRTASKLVIDGAPFIITPLPPGANAHDDSVWQQVYGASMDSFLSLLDGAKLFIEITNANSSVPSNVVFKDSLFHAKNSNLYEKLDERQQIQYVVSKDTVDDARAATTFGTVLEARSLGVRGPIQMVGWGKTIGMRPTDPQPTNRDNDNNHKMDRTTWKTGPVDLRWDAVRSCWRAWNDLIADQNGNGLGTLVFGTNGDLTEGFPYVRGKLEDVWTVRRTTFQEGTPISAAINSDIPKTAEVMTILSHRLFHESKSAAGPLSDVFIVNPSKGIGGSFTAGLETTINGLLTISTAADFNTDAGQSGPISFIVVPPAEIILGDMYWNGTQWQPGLEIDICNIADDEFEILVDNDKGISNALQDTITQVFTFINESINTFAQVQDQVNDNIVGPINNSYTPAVEDAIKASAENVVILTSFNVQTTLNVLRQNVQDALNGALIDIINQLSEVCGCSITAPEITIAPANLGAIEVADPSIGITIQDIAIDIPNGHITAPIWNINEPCDPATTSFPP